jgi:hypothetical protein
MKKEDLPKKIAVFPLSNFIIFPNTSVPLNIFEPRYIDMVNDSMNTNKFIGMIQPKAAKNNITEIKDLHQIGCLGKITNFKKLKDERYLIELRGLIRFKIVKEIGSNRRYREFEVDFNEYLDDLSEQVEKIQFSDLELIFKNLKSLFEKRGFIINWKALEKQNLNETINALAMASPFNLEEKQILLESKNLHSRKTKISEILSTYIYDEFNNTTIQ